MADSQAAEQPQIEVSANAANELAAYLKQRYHRRISGELHIPARPARFSAFPSDLDQRLIDSLRSRGIEQLYSHQAEAWQSIQAGNNTVIVTPTASGKTLCYNLPVMQSALNSKTKALYLFPTKALSQDQVSEIIEINNAGELGIKAFTFDGDTPGDARKAVRTRGDIVVSNPDMLHQGILPHHTKWAQFFEGLRYVVIDEMHTYRGVFGSHLANVLRRLKRICRFYGTDPVFIMCSATIANPGELAEQLLGTPVKTVDQSGAPAGEKTLLLWNPPVVNQDLGIRASARSQTSTIAKLAMRAGLKSIVFAQTRLMVEVLTKYLKDTFDKDPRRPPRVQAYRGGYLPTERRSTEKQLRAGSVDCVVATSALELGVDIGALDVCLLNGYPGSVAGTWQRLGRAGRRNRPALGVLVASSMPLDQYLVRHPEFFFGASAEHARISPDQLLILLDHIRCAAFELPFKDGEKFGGQPLTQFLEYLQEDQVLHHEGDQWHWMTDGYPANAVSLRSVAEGNFVVIDITDGGQKVIAEVDYSSAALTIYEGAIYLIQAKPWQVETLNWEGRKGFVRQTQADYYTDAIDYNRLSILDNFATDSRQCSSISHGEVHLLRRVSGYKKIRYYTHENVGYGNVSLPDQEMHTTAVWWQANPDMLDQKFQNRWQALDGFLGAAQAMHFVAALISMSEKHDLGRAVGNSDAGWVSTLAPEGRGKLHSFSGDNVDINDPNQSFCPTVFLYDNYPGGIGLSSPLYDLRDTIVLKARNLISTCPCEQGCPACIGPILGEDEAITPKQGAIVVLDLLSDSA